jgi:hypothetical protein
MLMIRVASWNGNDSKHGQLAEAQAVNECKDYRAWQDAFKEYKVISLVFPFIYICHFTLDLSSSCFATMGFWLSTFTIQMLYPLQNYCDLTLGRCPPSLLSGGDKFALFHISSHQQSL